MDLPNQIIESILNNLKLNDLLKLRVISTRWKNMIEDFCSRKKSIALVRTWPVSSYDSGLRSSTTNNRFFGAVKLERFVGIQLKKKPPILDSDLLCLILKLFPDVHQFAFHAGSDSVDADTIENLTCLFFHWRNMDTFTFWANIGDSYMIGIAAAINGMNFLTRLDIRQRFNMSLLVPILKRLVHLSLGFRLDEDECVDTIRLIGPHCERLWIEPFIPLETLSSLIRDIDDIGTCLSDLTHFGYPLQVKDGLELDDTLKFIDMHFWSLSVWYITYVAGETETSRITFSGLGHMTGLKEVRVLHTFCYVPIATISGDTKAMENVHTFEFRWSYPAMDVDGPQKFCLRLSCLLPNVKYLILVFSSKAEVEAVKKYLYMFRNLHKYKISFYTGSKCDINEIS